MDRSEVAPRIQSKSSYSCSSSGNDLFSEAGKHPRSQLISIATWRSKRPSLHLAYISPPGRAFSFDELSSATNSFHPSQIIGRGNFGIVYGAFLPGTGTIVAVKQLPKSLWFDRDEFITRAKLMCSIQHKNIVPTLGWCHDRGEPIVVLQYMHSGDLQALLHKSEFYVMPWSTRFKSIRDVAAALIYMHEEWVQVAVHRDVKAGNVMFDGEMNARLGDFGLAYLTERDKDSERFSGIAGTWGYTGPEMLVERAKITPGSDVFSWGILAMEVATGKKPAERGKPLLVDWVWDLERQGKLLEAADPKMGGDFKVEEMKQVLLVSFACANPDMKARPTMRQAMAYLERRRKDGAFPHVPLSKPSCNVGRALSLLQGQRFCESSTEESSLSSSNF